MLIWQVFLDEDDINWLDDDDKLPESEMKFQDDWKNYMNLENGGKLDYFNLSAYSFFICK